MKFKPKSKLNHMLKNDITTILDSVLFFHAPKLESYIVPNVRIELKNKVNSIGVPEWADVGISYPQTCMQNTCPWKREWYSNQEIIKCNTLL